MKFSAEVDLLVVGGGVLGTFHAYHAVARGLQVVLLERHAAPRGASVRNFGQVVPSGLDAQWQRYGRASLRIYRELQQQADLAIRQQGTIYLASDDDEQTLIEQLQAINDDNDYPSELWTAPQCRDRYPQLRADYCRGGLFFPQEVSVNPRQMIHRLHQWLSAADRYQPHFQTSVIDLAVVGDRVVARTSDGRRFAAAKAILCSGHEFQTLFPERFAASDLETVKLQMLRLMPQPEVTIPGNVLTGLSIRRYEAFAQCPAWNEIKAREPEDTYWKRWGVHILFKQEADGGIILGDSHEYAPAAQSDALDFDLRREVNDYFIDEGKKIFDLADWRIETSWYGLYSQTKHPSGIFAETIDDRIHVVTGIGGKGMTSSAGYAKHSLEQIWND